MEPFTMRYQGYDLQSVDNAVQLRLILKDAKTVRLEYSEDAAAKSDVLPRFTQLCTDRDLVSDFSAELKMAEMELEGLILRIRSAGLLVFAGEKRAEAVCRGGPDVIKTVLICVMSRKESEE